MWTSWNLIFKALFYFHVVCNLQGILRVPVHFLISSSEHFLQTTLSSSIHHITHPIHLQVLSRRQVAITTATVFHLPQPALCRQPHIMEWVTAIPNIKPFTAQLSHLATMAPLTMVSFLLMPNQWRSPGHYGSPNHGEFLINAESVEIILKI